MLLSTVEELRLFSPTNAIDHIDTMAGFLDSSEQDFLKDKLGAQLYKSLCDYYRSLRDGEGGVGTYISKVTDGEELLPYARLLMLSQRIITFDALARAIDMQAISVNGSGVNMGVADDYPKADRETVVAYKKNCVSEAHSALNAMLRTLEEWTQEVANIVPGEESGDADEEKSEITAFWKKSHYYYLAAQLVIPSAAVLQDYLNIYESREKFIQMLPDLRYIQEDIIAPIIGEDLLDYLIGVATNGTDDKLMRRIIHQLRKAVARHLESRAIALKVGDPRREAAHNEAVRLTTDLKEYLTAHQADMEDDLLEAFTTSPLYQAPAEETAPYEPEFENNAEGSVMFVTPGLS